MGLRFPGASTPAAFWDLIAAGRGQAGMPPPGRWALDAESIADPQGGRDRVFTPLACLVDKAPCDCRGLHLDAREMQALDPSVHLLLAAGRDAWLGCVHEAVDRQRCGVIVGNIALPTARAGELAADLLLPSVCAALGIPPPPDGAADPRHRRVCGLPATLLAAGLGFGGGARTLDAACASGLVSVAQAMEELRSHRLDCVLAGGVSRPDSLYTQMGFSALGALSRSGCCRPFDERADGLLVGEGSGVVVLKRLADALDHGDHIHAVIAGYGLANDRSGALFSPESAGQQRALRAAYAQAGWQPWEVGHIECHGTGTPLGDAVEIETLRALWQEAPLGARAVIGSAKASVGHLLTAAGAVGVIKTLLAIQHRSLPPTANFTQAHPKLNLEASPFRVLSEAEDWEATSPRRAAVSAFGFGGINAHLLLEEWRPKKGRRKKIPKPPPPEAIAIIGMAAQVGPWSDLDALRPRLLGRDDGVRPQAAGSGSSWSSTLPGALGDNETLPAEGYWIDELELPGERLPIPPRELAALSDQQALMLRVALAAVDDAGLGGKDLDRTAWGASFGVELDFRSTDYSLRWRLIERLRNQGWDAERIAAALDPLLPPLDADRVMGNLGGIVVSRVARVLRLGGPCTTVGSDKSSGTQALLCGVRALQAGVVDVALVGAAEIGSDPRHRHAATAPGNDAAVALVCKRLADAQRDGNPIHAIIDDLSLATGNDAQQRATVAALGGSSSSSTHDHDDGSRKAAKAQRSIAAHSSRLCASAGEKYTNTPLPPPSVGHAGPAHGLLLLLRDCLCLSEGILPEEPGISHPHAWLHNRADGPRRLLSLTGSPAEGLVAVALREAPPELRRGHEHPLGPLTAQLLVLDAAAIEGDCAALSELSEQTPWDALAATWLARRETLPQHRCCLLCDDPARLPALLERAVATVQAGTPCQDSSLVYAPTPLAADGEPRCCWVFPGSGNHRPGSVRGLAAAWPRVLDRQHAENDFLRAQFADGLPWNDRATDLDHRSALLAQVWAGAFAADCLDRCGLAPDAILGCSLGETAGLVASRTWRDRDELLARMQASPLFSEQLAGACTAAREVWGSDTAAWTLGLVDRSAEALRPLIAEHERVYLLIILTQAQCVIGGDPTAVAAFVTDIGCHWWELQGVTSVHCAVAQPVAAAYHALHVCPTTPPPGLRVYSGHLGKSYQVSPQACADSILGQALDTLDWCRVVRQAWDDGLRVFIECGPGNSATRSIAAILADRPHAVVAVDPPGDNDGRGLLQALAVAIAHGLNPDLTRLDHRLGGSSSSSTIDMLPQKAFRSSVCSSVVASHLWSSWSSTLPGGHPPNKMSPLENRRPIRRRLGLPPLTVLEPPRSFDRTACLEIATGKLGNVLGPRFAAVDSFPTRVRLPAEPLMLVDRISAIEGEPLSMGSGRIVTEHDIHADDWYLDAGVMPTSITVESGQADLFLSGWLGIDFVTRGAAVYRLLDATIIFHDALPGPGTTAVYDIHIDGFFRQGDTHLFRFRFEGTVDGKPLLSMRDGIAGFFTPEALAAGQGVVIPSRLRQPEPGQLTPDYRPLVALTTTEAYDDAALDALRRGEIAACFGPAFAAANPQRIPCLPDGRMRLVHRIVSLEPQGGRHGLGRIVGEADIHPDDWFLTCHFCDDMVMPGTLMYECCLHTLRVFLLRLGWVPLAGPVVFEPIPGIGSTLKCRGQVLQTTRSVHYEITLKRLGYDEAGRPIVIADALMYGDGRPIVHMLDMSLRLRGLHRDDLEQHWCSRRGAEAQRMVDISASSLGMPVAPTYTQRSPVVNEEGIAFDDASITAFAEGDPSAAFGSRYRVFDRERVIARLPRAPYKFLNRIVAIDGCQQWAMRAGGRIVAEYDVPPDAWYFAADGQAARLAPPLMPYCVLLEAALQPCGWLSAYIGSALSAPHDLSYRNLGGTAVQHRPVTPDIGTLTTTVEMTSCSTSGGMVIQQFSFDLACDAGPVYTGTTQFGFFSKQALANQIGIRDADPYRTSEAERARALSAPYPQGGPYPGPELRMLTRIDAFVPDGGPAGLGLLEASLDIDPSAWYFRAHFHQDPVTPGSLGLESFLQLLRLWACERWGGQGPGRIQANALGEQHRWVYRGQVLPSDERVWVQAVITSVDDEQCRCHADGWLGVDGRIIYRMMDYSLDWA